MSANVWIPRGPHPKPVQQVANRRAGGDTFQGEQGIRDEDGHPTHSRHSAQTKKDCGMFRGPCCVFCSQKVGQPLQGGEIGWTKAQLLQQGTDKAFHGAHGQSSARDLDVPRWLVYRTNWTMREWSASRARQCHQIRYWYQPCHTRCLIRERALMRALVWAECVLTHYGDQRTCEMYEAFSIHERSGACVSKPSVDLLPRI